MQKTRMAICNFKGRGGKRVKTKLFVLYPTTIQKFGFYPLPTSSLFFIFVLIKHSYKITYCFVLDVMYELFVKIMV